MGQEVVYVIGVFDLFHRGHVELLRKAKMAGERLVVAINGDTMTTQYKRSPICSEVDRLEVVKSCRFVDDAFIINEFDNKPYIEKFKVTKIVHGDDWPIDSYLKQICVDRKYLKEMGVEMLFVPYWNGISTSDIISKISKSKND